MMMDELRIAPGQDDCIWPAAVKRNFCIVNEIIQYLKFYIIWKIFCKKYVKSFFWGKDNTSRKTEKKQYIKKIIIIIIWINMSRLFETFFHYYLNFNDFL